MKRSKPIAAGEPPEGMVFDLDGTLYHANAMRFLMLVHMLAAAVARPFATLRSIRSIAHYRRAQEWIRRNHPDRYNQELQLNRASQTSGVPVREIADAVRYWMEELPARFLSACARRDVARIIRALAAKGLPVGVYSDYPAAGKVRQLGLSQCVRVVVSGQDAGVESLKPHPRGFLVVAEKLGAPISRILYVGDRADVDLAGAQAAGMPGLLVDDLAKWYPTAEGRMGRPGSRNKANGEPMEAREAECWICGSTMTRRLRPSTISREIDSRSVRITDSAYGQTGALRECRRCGFVFCDPVPREDLVSLYRQMDDPDYQQTSDTRSVQMRHLLDIALTHCPEARSLLDVGAGTGLMVKEAMSRGLLAEGVEPSRWCVDTGLQANRVSLLCGTLEELGGRLGQYDIVALVDVVEHVSDPLDLLRRAGSHMKPDGIMMIVTPDFSSAFARLMGRYWWHCRVAHVCYFNPGSMTRALHAAGLEAQRVLYAGWQFPWSYVLTRLARYLFVPPVGTLLRALAGKRRFQTRVINLNLRDSRIFIARQKEPQCFATTSESPVRTTG
jgi:putative hydrolase of the HAD superfamily